MEYYLPLAAIEKLMREGGERRVSESSKQALRYVLEKRAEEVGVLAQKCARHAGRSTVREEDILFALEQLT